MPTRKQRRRRDKGKRHEYEYVYVDDEGNEVEVPEEERPSRNGKTEEKKPVTRSGRVLEPPSWRRTARRGALFAPLMFIVVHLLDNGNRLDTQQEIGQTALLLLFFLPFSYLMDMVVWRSYQKRLAKQKR